MAIKPGGYILHGEQGKEQGKFMSFQFNWPSFDPDFKTSLALQIEEAINAAAVPSTFVGKIAVSSFEPGSTPPELEFLEIGELGLESFRGLFRLAYNGDASITFQVQLQSNPLHISDLTPGRRTSTEDSFMVPIQMTISHICLNTIIALNISKHHGVTLTFRNDPLESLQVSSTFDGISSLKDYIQAEIEGRLREALRTELPRMLHEETKGLLSRRDSISEGVDEVQSRKSSITSIVNGPIRVRTGPRPSTSPTLTSTADLPPIPEDDLLETTSLQHSITHSTTSRLSIASSRFPSMVRSRHGSVLAGHHQIPMARRLEILRSQHGSLSPMDVMSGAVVHRVSVRSGPPSRPRSPKFSDTVD